MSSQDFDSSAQYSFKAAMSDCIPGIDPYNINITSYYESNATRRLATTYLRRNLESVSILQTVSPSSQVSSSTTPTPTVSRHTSTTTSVHKAHRQLATIELTVNWALDFVLQDAMKSSQNATILLSSFVDILSEALSNTSNIETELRNADPQAFGSIEVESEPLNETTWKLSIEKLFVRSSIPTGQPTSSPTDLYNNAKLQQVQMLGPLSASQFYGMIGFVIGVCFLLPIAFYVYRQRGEEKRKKMQLKISRMRFESNKAKLSAFHIERRDALRWAFRKKFGRDINVYSDCIDPVGDISQMQFDPMVSKDDNMPIPGSSNSLNLRPVPVVARKLVSRLSNFSSSAEILKDPGIQFVAETKDVVDRSRRGVISKHTAVDVNGGNEEKNDSTPGNLIPRDQIPIEDTGHFPPDNVYLLYGDYPSLIYFKEDPKHPEKNIETKAFESLKGNHIKRKNDTSSSGLSTNQPKTVDDTNCRMKPLHPNSLHHHDLSLYSDL
jgi:hypothetical protein